MKASATLPEDEELKRCRQEAEALDQQLREMSELPARLAREKHDSENTIPPNTLVAEARRLRAQEEDLATRREARNHRNETTRNVLLIVLLAGAIVALIAWGVQLMNGPVNP